MLDPGTALALLQWGDSAFPAGGFAFSWGIEGLMADGLLADPGDLDEVMAEHLSSRWDTMDRVLLRRAFASPDLAALASLDRLAEAATPSAEMREGSRRAGRALLGTATRLGQARAAAYRKHAGSDPRHGHLAVAQGLVYAAAGLPLGAAELLSGWTLLAGLAGAAVRLGLVGHVEAQHALTRGRAVLGGLLLVEPDHDAEPGSFTPLSDIAVSRGAGRHVRLFIT